MSKWASIGKMFKGPTGDYDVTRVLFGAGGFSGIFSPVIFQAIDTWHGKDFDPVSYCTGYGIMLGAILTGGGIATATKDKGVASALNTTPPSPPEGGQP